MRVRAGIALVVTMLLSSTVFASPALAATNLLPDMRMAPIYSIQIQTGEQGRKKLRFGTIAFNDGDGPLEVRGKSRRRGEMTVIRQWIHESDGTSHGVLKSDAEIFYARDGHDHWHVARFIVVRLRPNPGTTASERRIRKLGFCLVDSAQAPVGQRPPNAVNTPAYGDCGWSKSSSVRLGVSVGWGDNYPPEFTFQSIDVSGLPQGNYRICATVNPKGIWTEKNNNFSNNSYWMDLDLDVATNQLTVTNTGETACW